jgi:hypothetical protein
MSITRAQESMQVSKGPGKKMKKKIKSKKVKKKSKFPDMSGDGKVTKKDILMARGVIKKPGAKNGRQ